MWYVLSTIFDKSPRHFSTPRSIIRSDGGPATYRPSYCRCRKGAQRRNRKTTFALLRFFSCVYRSKARFRVRSSRLHLVADFCKVRLFLLIFSFHSHPHRLLFSTHIWHSMLTADRQPSLHSPTAMINGTQRVRRRTCLIAAMPTDDPPPRGLVSSPQIILATRTGWNRDRCISMPVAR